MMKDAFASKPIARADYQPYNYLIRNVDLVFDLFETYANVRSTLQVSLNPESTGLGPELVLDGKELVLLAVRRDGVALVENDDYTIDGEKMILRSMPDDCEIEIETKVFPAENTALEGLYQSSGNFCTQCEAEGFRRISYFPDRPDVMACFDVKIIADKNRYPVLLSNGNQSAAGELADGRHWVSWHDPHPKPCYLFALVAGDLATIQDQFVTASGRQVDLRIYVEEHNSDKCAHAMASLILAMRWDEKVYGLEYDLDIYMIVAVDDFNMGAMENKGLNIFNSKYVLANQRTATDTDFQGVEAVIAHEYFHNWTGNRVTCRDWFQLSLKEGLTVFRDQEFSADMNSRSAKRIEDVRLLRARQFPEDAGPMAHPIRPDSYIEINNFYTVTIYEKGAEVIRMMHTMLGQDRYRQGMDLYFERHDGQAVTCEDFVNAMETASGVDLKQFRHWYSQAGTPKLKVVSHYNAKARQYRLEITQSCAASPGMPDKKPFHLPFSVSLYDSDGQPIALKLDADSDDGPLQRTLDIKEVKSEFIFHHVQNHPVPSLLRGFSAPVRLDYEYTNNELGFLLAHDTDSFNRWEAGQILATRSIEYFASNKQFDIELDTLIFEGLEKLLSDSSIDHALRAEALQLPTIEMIAERHEHFDIDSLDHAHKSWKLKLATTLEPVLARCLAGAESDNTFGIDAAAIGRRALHNRCLSILVLLENSQWPELAKKQFNNSTNMTDQLAALAALINCQSPYAKHALGQFYTQWQAEKLVIDKWFAIQAMADTPETIANVRQLLSHPDFDIKNPNRIRSLIGAFSMSNPVCFHNPDGQGYQLLQEIVLELDDLNPQVAARLASGYLRWRRFDSGRQRHLKNCLEIIAAKENLSGDVYEIVSKALY